MGFHQNCFQKYWGSEGDSFFRCSLSLWPLPSVRRAQRIHHEKQPQKHSWDSLTCRGNVALTSDSIRWKSATLMLRTLNFEISRIRKFAARAFCGLVSCKKAVCWLEGAEHTVSNRWVLRIRRKFINLMSKIMQNSTESFSRRCGAFLRAPGFFP